jgi:hypothetical protein
MSNVYYHANKLFITKQYESSNSPDITTQKRISLDISVEKYGLSLLSTG